MKTERGVPQDYQLALKWHKLAVEKGDAEAQFKTGVLYENGIGVPKDYVLAYKWFNLAAAKGVKKASKWRDDLAKEMNTSQLSEAQKLAREFKPKKENP